jgi:hypothetical protein
MDGPRFSFFKKNSRCEANFESKIRRSRDQRRPAPHDPTPNRKSDEREAITAHPTTRSLPYEAHLKINR